MTQDNMKEPVKTVRRFPKVSELPIDSNARLREQPKLVSRFYDAVTSFYEFAWGSSFHFSPRHPGESLQSSQLRHEKGIAKLLRLSPGMEIADVGCGVGGPLVNIAKASGAKIVGINFNELQIQAGNQRVQRAGLSDSCSFLHADYRNVPLEEGAFDALYSFEALCHAPDRKLAFLELFRLLKPGAEAAIVDWAFTEKFDPSNNKHDELRRSIEANNATPELDTKDSYVETVRDAGFDVILAKDQTIDEGSPSTPWYMALQGRDFSLASLARTPVGRSIVARITSVMELLRVAPTGSSETARQLNIAADALVEAGKLGIFTPSFLVHARKPA